MTRANVDGSTHRKLEQQNYLKETNPKAACLAAIELKEENQTNNNCNMWGRDRTAKGEGGVMIMTRNEMKTKIMKYGEGKAEMVSVNLEDNNGVILMVITNSWSKEDCEKVTEDTIQYLNKLIKNSK